MATGAQPAPPAVVAQPAVAAVQTMSLGMIANTVESFTGKGNVKRYFEKFEQRAKLDNWTQDQGLQIFKYRLSGDAYNFFTVDKSLHTLSFVELKEKFIKRFEPFKVPGRELANLNKCFQSHNETVVDFVTRLRLIGMKILEDDLKNASTNEEVGIKKKNSELLLNQFINGLNKNILKNVGTVFMRDDNLTIDSAAEYAIQEETNQVMSQRNPTINVVNCYVCGNSGHIARECRNNANNNQRERGNFSKRNERYNQRDRPNYNRRNENDNQRNRENGNQRDRQNYNRRNENFNQRERGNFNQRNEGYNQRDQQNFNQRNRGNFNQRNEGYNQRDQQNLNQRDRGNFNSNHYNNTRRNDQFNSQNVNERALNSRDVPTTPRVGASQ